MIQYAVEYWDGKAWCLGHSESDLKLTADGDIPLSIRDKDYGFCKFWSGEVLPSFMKPAHVVLVYRGIAYKDDA